MTRHIPLELHEALYALGEAILPLSTWGPGGGLTLKAMKALEALDQLIEEDDAGVDERWQRLGLDPWCNHPIPRADIAIWRYQRGLDPHVARFAMNATNWPTIADPNELYSRKTKPDTLAVAPPYASRSAFYAACWPRFASLVALLPAEPNWEKLVESLQEVSPPPGWPPGPPSAQRFIRTYARDLVICVTSLKPGRASPLNEELLSALGERRRPGNRFTTADTEAATAAMVKTLDALWRPASTKEGETQS